MPLPAISGSLPAPTTRGDTNNGRVSTHHNAGAVFVTSLLNVAMKPFPSGQARQGDRKLARARNLVIEFESVIAVNDRRNIEDRITQ